MASLRKLIPEYISIAGGCEKGYLTRLTTALRLGVTTADTPIIEGGIFATLSNAKLYIQSNNALDTTIEYKVSGLDQDFNEQNIGVILNGLIQVEVGGNWSRVFAIRNASGQTLTTPVAKTSLGTITLTNLSKSETYLTAPTNNQSAKSACFTIPAGYTAFLQFTDWTLSKKGSDVEVTINSYVRGYGGVFVRELSDRLLSASGGSKLYDVKAAPFPIPEKTDILLTAMTDSGTSDVAVAVAYILVSNQNITEASRSYD